MTHAQHIDHHKKAHKKRVIASGSLIAIGSGLLSFSVLSLSGFGL